MTRISAELTVPKLATFDVDDFPRIIACDAAEARFVETILGLEQIAISGINTIIGGARIITDNDRPVIIQKSLNEKSGLTLTDTLIGGSLFPPGYIVGVRALDADGRLTYAYSKTNKVEVMNTGEVTGLSLGRKAYMHLTTVHGRKVYMQEAVKIATSALAQLSTHR